MAGVPENKDIKQEGVNPKYEVPSRIGKFLRT